MDLTCKVVSILPEQSFTGRQGEFVRFGFVGETQGQYPKKVKFDVLGRDKWEKLSPFIVLGSDVQVFFDVNYQGTVNLCLALEKAGVPKTLIFISTVAVYGCEYGDMITEEHPLEGNSPYAESKIMAEEYLTEWCTKNGVILGILRPSLLAGKNAPGNLGAMVNGIKKGFYMNIAGGRVVKSILMAEDIARLIPLLEEKGGIYTLKQTMVPTKDEERESTIAF